MRIFVDRQQVPPQDVELDRVRWEMPREKKAVPLVPLKTLYVELVAEDLAALGEKLHKSYREILAKEPEFFRGELMEDVPRPGSPALLVEKPLKLKSYLRRGSWWRDETVQTLLGMINPWKTGETRYWVEDFRDLKVDGEFTILIFAARLAGTTGSKPRLELTAP